MPGYLIATLDSIRDPDIFTAYQKAASNVFEQYGAQFVLNSREVENLDGDWHPYGIVVVEFESYELARKFYDSTEYQAIIGQRFDSAVSSVIITSS